MAWGRWLYHVTFNVDIPFDSTEFNNDNTMDIFNDAYKDCEGDSKAFRIQDVQNSPS